MIRHKHKHKHTRRTNLSSFLVLTAYTYVDPVFACLTVLVLMLICASENKVKDRRDRNVRFSPTQTSC